MNLRNMKAGEDTEQIKLMNWAKSMEDVKPELHLLFHIPNGGKRGKLEAERFKAMGVKAGVPDLMLPVPRGKYKGIFIEMKYGDNTVSVHQRVFMRAAQDNGYYCVVCYGAAAAKRAIQIYLSLNGEAEITEASFEEVFNYKIHKTWGIPVVKPQE